METSVQQSRSKSTVASILAAAEGLFLRAHYADVTLDRVAEEARVTKGAIYHHFPSKEDLYLRLLHADLEEKRALHERAAQEPGTAEERLRRLTASFLALPRSKRALIQLVRRDSNLFADEVRADLVRAYQQALPHPIEEILRDGIRQREIVAADPRLLAWHFVALVEVVLTPYAEEHFSCDEDRLNHVVSLFFDGCAQRARKEAV